MERLHPILHPSYPDLSELDSRWTLRYLLRRKTQSGTAFQYNRPAHDLDSYGRRKPLNRETGLRLGANSNRNLKGAACYHKRVPETCHRLAHYLDAHVA